MKTITLLSGATSTGAGSTEQTNKHLWITKDAQVQIEITGTAGVTIKGKAAPGAPEVDLTSEQSSSGLVSATALPFMWADVTSYTSGDVNVWLTLYPSD